MGLQNHEEVLQYLIEKHDKVAIMGCGCGSKKRAGEEIVANSDGYIMARYIWPNAGRHDVGWGLGRHLGAGAETFLVPEEVVDKNPHKFEAIVEVVADPIPAPEEVPPPVAIMAPPVEMARPIDLGSLKPTVQRSLREAGRTTKEAIAELGLDGLQRMHGIGPSTARQIMELAE